MMRSCLLYDLTRVHDDRDHFHPCHPSNQGRGREFFIIPRVLGRIGLEQCYKMKEGERKTAKMRESNQQMSIFLTSKLVSSSSTFPFDRRSMIQ